MRTMMTTSQLIKMKIKERLRKIKERQQRKIKEREKRPKALITSSSRMSMKMKILTMKKNQLVAEKNVNAEPPTLRLLMEMNMGEAKERKRPHLILFYNLGLKT